MKKTGKKKPYRYKSFLTTPEIEAALEKAAIEQDRSEAWIIRKALNEYMEKMQAGLSKR